MGRRPGLRSAGPIWYELRRMVGLQRNIDIQSCVFIHIDEHQMLGALVSAYALEHS